MLNKQSQLSWTLWRPSSLPVTHSWPTRLNSLKHIICKNLQSCSKVLEVFHQLLHILQRDRIVVASAHTANTAVTLKTLEQALLSTCDERLFLRVISTANAEADVHTTADTGVGNNLVHLRVLIQSTVDKLCLFVGDLLLAADLLGAELGHQIGHDLAGDPEVENREGVVEGVVLCDGSVVEYDWAWETADVQSVEKGGRRSRGLGWEEVLADNGDGDTGNTDVFLSTALYRLLAWTCSRDIEATHEDDGVFANINLAADEVGAHISNDETLILGILALCLQ